MAKFLSSLPLFVQMLIALSPVFLLFGVWGLISILSDRSGSGRHYRGK